MEKIRLQKFFTDCGVMSRRACEKEIEAGNILVNGKAAFLGDKIDPDADEVIWNGKTIRYTRKDFTYIMLNKPMGYVTTMSDEKGRKTAAELVSGVGVRVFPVGRLDMYSEGLLIFTDDGELANKLTHPSGNLSKEYSVKIKGLLTEDDINALRTPMELDGYRLRPVEAALVSSGTDRDGCDYSILHITLYEGRNRQIRRMCEKCGLTVMRLRRISECGISLGTLPPGKWRKLSENEINTLKNA
ncbi:MAG: pseudouridine synthase [Clostridia bacterium]|nr:pseudouridine synthase [Clostridia bacterium]